MSDNDNSNESFIRWQQRTIEERGKTINLFMGMSLATIGFVISQVIKDDFMFLGYWDATLVLYGSLGILITIIILATVVLLRLQSFAKTAKITLHKYKNEKEAEIKELRISSAFYDYFTLKFFRLSIWFFAISEIMIIVGIFLRLKEKF